MHVKSRRTLQCGTKFTELWFYVQLDTKQVILETFRHGKTKPNTTKTTHSPIKINVKIHRVK